VHNNQMMARTECDRDRVSVHWPFFCAIVCLFRFYPTVISRNMMDSNLSVEAQVAQALQKLLPSFKPAVPEENDMSEDDAYAGTWNAVFPSFDFSTPGLFPKCGTLRQRPCHPCGTGP
jgi:hypothetical protein